MWDVEQSASAIAQALAEDIDAINADLKAESIALGAAVDQEVQAFSEQARPELETSVRQQGPVLDELYDCSICQSAGARCAIVSPSAHCNRSSNRLKRQRRSRSRFSSSGLASMKCSLTPSPVPKP